MGGLLRSYAQMAGEVTARQKFLESLGGNELGRQGRAECPAIHDATSHFICSSHLVPLPL